ncbi:MAG: LemA family protein [Bacteroidetes bacterium]|nr:MAG: LemA family protein [Bacteroidota bacterium]
MTQKKWFIPVVIIGAIVVMGLMFVSWGNGVYNNAVSLQEDTQAQWGNVQAAYQRRADLVPQLVATVKGAAANENKILAEVTQARAGIVNAKTPQDMEMMGKKINTAINLAFEAYPEIKSTQNFRDLQAQLEGTENRINVERRRYNETAKEYNKYVRGLFRRWVLGIFGDEDEFVKKEMFQASAGAENAPKVEF